jgi:hypothetical protein
MCVCMYVCMYVYIADLISGKDEHILFHAIWQSYTIMFFVEIINPIGASCIFYS